MKKMRRIFALFLALIMAACVFPEVFVKEEKASAAVTSLRIGSFNIKNAGGGSQFDNIANQIREHNLDVIGLQEIDYYTWRCNHDTMKQLANRLGYYYAYFPAIDYEGGKYGVGTLSRYPIVSTWYKHMSYVREPRVLTHCLIKVSDSYSFNFYNTHLDTDGGAREKELKDINNNLTYPYVLVGDFNCAPTTQDNYIENSVWVHNANNKPATYQSGSCIDNIIASAGHYGISSSGVKQSGISDHYMVWAELKLVNLELEGHTPINLGENFAAHIRHSATGLYLTDSDYNVSLQSGVFNNSQTFNFVRQNDGSYTIGNYASGCCFEVDGGKYENGTNVRMSGNNGSGAQKFYIYYIDCNFYIRTAFDDKLLDVNAADGNVQIYGTETGIGKDEVAYIARSFEIFKLSLDNSSWNVDIGKEYSAYIRNWHTGLMMTAEGDNVVFKDATYDDNQKWLIKRNEYGGHEIKSASTGKVLDVAAANIGHRADINLYEANGSKAQNFFFIDIGESRFYIKPSYSATVADMDSADKELHACNYGTTDEALVAQVFELVTENNIDEGQNIRKPVYLGDTFDAKVFLVDSGKVLTAGNGVSMENATSNPNQVWSFKYDEKWNAYEIVSNTGLSLDVTAAAWTSGTQLQLYEGNNTLAQRFRFHPAGNGYIISPAHTQKLVDVDSNTGSIVQLYGNAVSECRLFGLTMVSVDGKKPVDLGTDFTSKIKNKASGLYLNGKAEGVLSCSSEMSEWVFTRQADGSYMIKDKNSGLYLDVYGCHVEIGTNVQLWEQNDSGAQNFFIYESNGGYLLRSLRSSFVVDMDAETKEVHIYPESNSEISVSAQVFEIVNGDIETEVDTLTIKNGSSFAKEESFVVNVPSQTTAEQIIAQFENSSVAVYDADGNQVTNNSLCGTGYTVNLISKGEVIDSLTIVVRGDIDGNAKTDSTDYIRVKSAFLGTFELSEAQHKAGDVEKDNRIDSTDYIQIKSAFLGKFDLYA